MNLYDGKRKRQRRHVNAAKSRSLKRVLIFHHGAIQMEFHGWDTVSCMNWQQILARTGWKERIAGAVEKEAGSSTASKFNKIFQCWESSETFKSTNPWGSYEVFKSERSSLSMSPRLKFLQNGGLKSLRIPRSPRQESQNLPVSR
ncbi:hypothetical protein PDE_04556 [Penicillium oxalicum 114-2]|uniref:Uncharacterized protein n=1 Tax=Penicillium oxalicum (strain 114-2 / CGMCC 5302) TaxID=933388 RepID=S7ZLN7_PENO1|nr:hypothetical protein PDE_04556 [Penicillium oxalicum 114-2]